MDSVDGVLVNNNKAEIDTRAPFRSVKEAVTLFGERVLAGELYANQLKEMHGRTNENGHATSKFGGMATELEETKQSLEKAKEESRNMSFCLSSLEDELESTKLELKHLKDREIRKELMEIDKFEVVKKQTSENHERMAEFRNKTNVTFANPPLVKTQVMTPQPHLEALERPSSLRKKKKKHLIPLIGGVFSKKK